MSEFLETILKAHGDLENWRKVERLEARVSLTGGLYQLKGFPEGVPNVTMSVDTRRPALTITSRRAWRPERIWIQDAGVRVDPSFDTINSKESVS